MKLYTKTGDDGNTGLFGGGRVAKDCPRVEAYGCVDELNASIGMAVASLDDSDAQLSIHNMLTTIQSRLFDLGADLATPSDSPHAEKVTRIGQDDIAQLEAWIDEIDSSNPPMQTFVLPGGGESSARLHIARTVCRRAERRVIALGRAEPVSREAVVFLNRLSDLLFATARRVNALADIPDVPWVKK